MRMYKRNWRGFWTSHLLQVSSWPEVLEWLPLLSPWDTRSSLTSFTQYMTKRMLCFFPCFCFNISYCLQHCTDQVQIFTVPWNLHELQFSQIDFLIWGVEGWTQGGDQYMRKGIYIKFNKKKSCRNNCFILFDWLYNDDVVSHKVVL